MIKNKKILTRAILLYAAIVLFAIGVIWKIFDISVIEQNKWAAKKETQILDLKTIEAPRGNIYAGDEQKKSLVISVPRYNVHLDLTVVKDEIFERDVDSLCNQLSVLFENKTKAEWKSDLLKQRKKENQYYLIKSKVRYEEIEKLKTFPIFKLGQYRGGVIIQRENKRVKPYGLLANRTLGYYIENEDRIYKVGIEGFFNEYLKGQDGKQLMKRIVGGDWKPVSTDYDVEPINGYDLYTSIDINIQDVAESALEKQLIEQKAERGCVVVMEVETGYIKAIANLERDTLDNCREVYNMAVGRKSEPGSTMKLASLITALEDGKINPQDTVKAYGTYRFYEDKLVDSKHGGYGKITIQEAFEVSSNVISKVINDNYKSNPQQFIDGLKKLGLHEKTGVTISGEPTPVLKNADDSTFTGITIPWMSIGYELEMTPLQMLSFYNGIANNGKLMQPQLVKEVRNGSQIIESFEPVVQKEKMCSENTIKIVKSMLEGVVERGTAKNVRARGYKIAGKTGTAQIAEQGSYGYKKKRKYQASFCGYFPAEKPKYSCIVVIQGPTKNIYGAIVSGTVFKEVADKVYASSIDINQQLNKGELSEKNQPYSKNGLSEETKKAFDFFAVNTSDTDSKWIATESNEDRVKLYSRNYDKSKIPNVMGMGLKDAIYALEQRGIQVKSIGSGRVVKQSISPGTEINNINNITLTLR